MTDRAAYTSSRLIFPVSSPWALERRGHPTAYLSVRQRALLIYLSKTQRRGRRTLAEMGRILGVTSRGQVSRELRRLRQLELIGYQARRGSRGSHHLWINRAAARLRLRRAVATRANDSTSTPFGGFITKSGLERAWRKRGRPLLPGRPAARDGPRRGSSPPRTLNARCPAGHPTRIGRRSWRTVVGGGLEAVFRGVCRRCGGREVSEIVSVTLPPAPPRAMSAEERADPGLVAARRRMAALFEADGLRLATVREYRDLADETVIARETSVSS